MLLDKDIASRIPTTEAGFLVLRNSTIALMTLIFGFSSKILIGSDMSPKEHQELKSYVTHLYVIDSQQALFELSHRLEPRA